MLCIRVYGHPVFKSAQKLLSESFERERETQFSFLRTINLGAKISQEEFSFPLAVTKSKLYEMLRCRYIMSILEHFSDDQIEEGISEFENDVLKEVKKEELINHDRTLLLTKAEKVA